MEISDVDRGRVLADARAALGLSLRDAGRLTGYSAPVVLRWERGERQWKVADLERVARQLGVPLSLVGLAEENPVRDMHSAVKDVNVDRRMFLHGTVAAAAAYAVPTMAVSSQHGSDVNPMGLRVLSGQVASAEADLNAERLVELERRMPNLIAAAQATVESVASADVYQANVLLARAYIVYGQLMFRTSREVEAASAADRASVVGHSVDHRPIIAETRRLSGAIRRRYLDPESLPMVIHAADNLEKDTHLSTDRDKGQYVHILCTAAYTAGVLGNVDNAWELHATARDVLSDTTGGGVITMVDVDVFAASIARVIGEPDLCLEVSRKINLQDIPTTHELFRLWQDVALSAAATGDHVLSLRAVERLDSLSPQHLRYRPWAHCLVDELLGTKEGGNSVLLRRVREQQELVRGTVG